MLWAAFFAISVRPFKKKIMKNLRRESDGLCKTKVTIITSNVIALC